MQKTRKQMLIALLLASLTPFAFAAGDLTRQEPITITVELGNKQNAMRFYPDNLEFETGKLYKLVLTNPSKTKHYFSSEGFSKSVFTRKVQVNNADNQPMAEIKGQISEIEVYPGGITEWWLVPVKTGHFKDLRCTISGHTEAGMTGSINIK